MNLLKPVARFQKPLPVRRRWLGPLSLALAALLRLCPASAAAADPAPILLVSMDGFRWDYCALHPTANIHLYNLMCAVLHLTPAPNDGDDRLVRAFLRSD